MNAAIQQRCYKLILTDLDGRRIDFKLSEDCERLLEQFVANGDVRDVGGVVVVQSIDVFHDTRSVCLDRRQDQQVLQIPEIIKGGEFILYFYMMINSRQKIWACHRHITIYNITGFCLFG